MEKQGTRYVNEQLPDNVCVMLYGMGLFPVYLEKLNDLWTGIILPKQDPEEKMSWTMAYLQYQKEGKDSYLIWFFDGEDIPKPNKYTDEKIIKEINQFLKDEEENSGVVIADLRK